MACTARLAPLDPLPAPQRRTPLHFAAYGGHLEVVRELIRLGADVNAVDVSDRAAVIGRIDFGVSMRLTDRVRSACSLSLWSLILCRGAVMRRGGGR